MFSFLMLSGCVTVDTTRDTLRRLDVANTSNSSEKVFIKPKSEEDIRKAYEDYLKHTTKNDQSRLDAINRLAELEFELSNKIQKENDDSNKTENNDLDETLYNERLNKTIELLKTSLRDYPKARGNDKILYQLAKAYDHKGDNTTSEKTLKILVHKYPKSPYYLESQFRIAENLFSKHDFQDAEKTYTDVLSSSKNNLFYEKSLFKRGWARFKQEYYLEAIDDFLEAVSYHNFDKYNDLSQNQLEQFNEYFRAIGLSFSYLGGAQPLNEYFNDNPGFKYIYYTYSHVSDIYLKQYRYSDAADTLEYFIKNHKNSEDIPISELKIIDIWKQGGFSKIAAEKITEYYDKYNPESKYWLSKHATSEIYTKSNKALKENILLASSYYHKLFIKHKKISDFKIADTWYLRYLKYYSSSAQKDNVYYQYASLLSINHQYSSALKNYEMAAYDGSIILNKNAAYATITITNQLFKYENNISIKNTYLNKHIKYATLYAQLYPNSKKSSAIVLHASELAFKSGQFLKAIDLAENITSNPGSKEYLYAQIIKAHSYFGLKQYENAESAYYTALSFPGESIKKAELLDKLALSIYKQAEINRNNGEVIKAINTFMRISQLAPTSSISVTGMYDAIALSMKNNLWDISIKNIKHFQFMYPHNKLNRDVTKKLSIAYLKSNQGIKAAKEFEKIADFEKNKEFKTAALWQAAELYESKGQLNQAIRSYEKYAKFYKKPYAQYMESMKNLTRLYTNQNNHKKVIYWDKQIIKADKRAINKEKTERTRYITSSASLNIATAEHKIFSQQKLVLPLNLSLKKKKQAMQKAIKYYAQASKYGIAETATESTFEIAQIYQSFSKDLLKSERPKNLKGPELDQYVILLEDKAYPFEDKAIEFYETNMSHVKEGVYNKWIKQSLDKLRDLFPARYNRAAKLDRTINVLH